MGVLSEYYVAEWAAATQSAVLQWYQMYNLKATCSTVNGHEGLGKMRFPFTLMKSPNSGF